MLREGSWEDGGSRGETRVTSGLSCLLAAQCEMSEWGPWGPCSKKRKLCGFKKGNEDRTRRILQAPSGDVSLCPATTEVRRCTVQKSQCPEGERAPSVSPPLPSTTPRQYLA